MPQWSHKSLLCSCKSPLPCLTWRQRKDVLHHQTPDPWHTRNGTHAGTRMQGVDMFASGGVFLLFMSLSSTSCSSRPHMRRKYGVMSPLARPRCLKNIFMRRPEEADVSQNTIGHYLSSCGSWPLLAWAAARAKPPSVDWTSTPCRSDGSDASQGSAV